MLIKHTIFKLFNLSTNYLSTNQSNRTIQSNQSNQSIQSNQSNQSNPTNKYHRPGDRGAARPGRVHDNRGRAGGISLDNHPVDAPG